jgi:hypothetical protein
MLVLGTVGSQNTKSFLNGDFESIQTTTVGAGGSLSVTLSSIPSTYLHLQARLITRGGTSGNLRINSDTGNNYTRHYSEGNGSAAIAGGSGSQPYIDIVGNTTTASLFSVNIIDFLDYASTNKLKTVRNLNGVAGSYAGISSGLWTNTAAITSITFTSAGGNYAQYSTFALYGIKG